MNAVQGMGHQAQIVSGTRLRERCAWRVEQSTRSMLHALNANLTLQGQCLASTTVLCRLSEKSDQTHRHYKHVIGGRNIVCSIKD